MVKCPNCGRDNAEHFNFCLDCGTELPVRAPVVASVPLPAEPPPLSAPPAAAFAPPAAAFYPPASAPPAAGFAPAAAAPVVSTPSSGPAPAGGPCPSCQTPVPAGMRFCGACGARLDGSQPAGAPVSSPPGYAPAVRTQFIHAADMSALTQPKARLIVIDQTGKEGMQFNLKAAETVCGRTNGIILFFDDAFVSPTHCLFKFNGGRLAVKDLNSVNGVFVRLRTEVELQHGDMIRMGRQLMRFEDEASLPREAITRAADDDSRLWGSPDLKPFGRLVQLMEDGRLGEVRLLKGAEMRVGREIGDILFTQDGFVSGQHAIVTYRGGRVFLRDLGSSNGTYLRIRGERELAQDDFMLIGNQLLRVDQR